MKFRHLAALCILAPAAAARAGDTADSSTLGAQILADNSAWLAPKARDFSFTFAMKHEGKEDKNEFGVEFKAPDMATFIDGEKRRNAKVDNHYDPNNTAYPPALQTLLQGTTLFGPLQELALEPESVKIAPLGEETLDGRPARVFKLVSQGRPSEKAMAKWETKVKGAAARSRHIYALKAAIVDGPTGRNPELRAESLLQAGARWAELQSELKRAPNQLVWKDAGGYAKYTALIMPDAAGKERAWIAIETADAAAIAPEATLYESSEVIDVALLGAFKRLYPKPERALPMRIGCGGIGCGWYGYSGGGAHESKLWLDKKTGAPLREEGYWNGVLASDIEYKEFAKTPNGKTVPTHLLVTLDRNDRDPWVFEIWFKLHDGGLWLMDHLDEYQSGKLVAKGWTSNIVAK